MNNNKRNPVQFPLTLWELMNKSALIESNKQGRVITASQYVLSICEKAGNRVVRKNGKV